MPAGGTVRLEVAAGPRIVVADDGPGIPPDLAPRVFDRFRRGAEAADTPGHGLGLSLARAIAERHDLTLKLAGGQPGARFEIAFPRRMVLSLKLLGLLPYPLYFALTSKMLRRG